MKIKPAIFLALLLATSRLMQATAAANAPPSFDAALAAAFPELQGKYPWAGELATRMKQLTPDQCNQIGAAATRELALHTTNGDAITAETVDRLLFQRSAEDTPRKAALRCLCNLDYERVDLLRFMENEKLLTTPEVIGPLVAMLDFPGTKLSVRDEAAQALGTLTGRDYVNYYRYTGAATQVRFAQWWRDWWAKNRNRHPVYDAALQAAVKTRVTAIRNQIFLEVKGYGGVAFGGIARSVITRPEADNLMTEALESTSSPEPRPAYKGQFFLNITAHFETTRMLLNPAEENSGFIASTGDLPKERHYPAGMVGEWHPLKPGKGYFVEEVWREELPGTDIAISVDAASEDGIFPGLVRACLQKPPESVRPEIMRLTAQLHDANMANSAAYQLVYVGEYAAVIEALSNTNLLIRQSAIAALGGTSLRDNAKISSAVPPLVHLLSTGDPYTRYLAAWALGNVLAEPRTTVPALIAATQDGDAQVRPTAIQSLLNFQSQADSVIPVLNRLLTDPHAEVRREAAKILESYRPHR